MEMDKKKENKPQQINVELGEKEAEGIYSNLAIISHSPAEFVFDFTRLLPGTPTAKVLSRIIMTPQHAKLLLRALGDNIHKFEMAYGNINIDGPMENLIEGFGSGSPKIN